MSFVTKIFFIKTKSGFIILLSSKAPGCTVALSDPSACREKNTGKRILSILPPGANVSILVVGVGIHVDNF